jgi:uncharacterized protein involved in exopolysaccharide biosynthesis
MNTPQPQESDYNPLEETQREISLLDLAVVLAENIRLLVIGPLAVGLSAIGISFLIPPVYTAKTVLLPPQQQQSSAAAALQSLGALAGIAGGAAGIRSPADQYVALMQSTTVEDRIIERFSMMTVYDSKFLTDARKTLEENTRIGAGKKDGLLTIEFDDEDPQRAADIANAYVDELRRLTSNLALTEAQQRRSFFERQLLETRDRLAAAQKALQAAGINEGVIRAEPKAAAEAYARIQAEITASEVRIQTMRSYLAETAPEFTQAQSQLAGLRAQLARREADNSAGTKGNYTDRYREFKYQETLFDLFARQYELARLDESREGALIQVVDVAKPPERKSKPRRASIAIAATLTAGIALIIWVVGASAWRRANVNYETASKVEILSTALRRSIGDHR